MSPGDEERRPAAEPDGARNLIVGDDISNGTSTPLHVRRRRRASYRCPRIVNGRQSTLKLKGVGTTDTPDVVAEIGRRTVWWSADGRNLRLIYLACETVGSKRMRDPLVGLLCSPITHASDVIACLEYRHRLTVRVVEVDR